MERPDHTPPRAPAQPAPPERVPMDAPAPPAVLRHDVPARQEPTSPRPAARDIPIPPPVPTPTELLMDAPPAVPPFQQFSFLAAQPLSAADLDVITTFHALYMQDPQVFTRPPTDKARWDLVRQAQEAATLVKPLMERQLTLARQGAEGDQGGEARTVAVNLQWVNDLLAAKG